MKSHIKLFRDFLNESTKKPFILKKYKYKGGIGEIRFGVYPDDVIVFMGSYVDKEYRGQGIFKKMLETLLPKFEGKKVYVPVSNPIIIELFERLGFKRIDGPIRYWGDPENNVNMFKQF